MEAFDSIRSNLPLGAKQYLVLLYEEAKKNSWDSEEMHWPVHVVEVTGVKPQLKDKSFDMDEPHYKIYSRIELLRGTERRWFNAPYFEFDSQSMALDILNEFEA